MHTVITSFHAQHNLGIVQLATSEQDSFSYVGCGKAFSDKFIDVKELSDAGSVNTIFVLNTSDKFVFIMDGDILAGAKQNRVVNTSILLAPQSKTQIPVSCVERGRWDRNVQGFSASDFTAPASLRADKDEHVRRNLKEQRGFASDQGEIWASVDRAQMRFKTASKTSNLSDIYGQKQEEFDVFLKGFVPDAGSNGMAVFIGKKLVGIDLFNRKDIFLEYYPKMLRGAAFDATSSGKKKPELAEAEARYKTLEMLDRFDGLQFEQRPGVGVGLDRRFETNEMRGFELVYDAHLIHRAAFAGKAINTPG